MGRLLTDKNVLILSVFVAGLCSLVYELLISTTSSYFLGDSVRQFSITIGLYLAAMGLGSYISRLLKTELLRSFVAVEILLGIIGGTAVPMLYLIYAFFDLFWPSVVLLIIVIGALTGLEIPLLTRIMEEDRGRFDDSLDINLSNVLSFDYLGALLATLAFPFLLLPLLGTFRASLVLGLLNISVGALCLWWFADALSKRTRRQGMVAIGLASALLAGLLIGSGVLMRNWSDSIYEDRVVYREQTPYQRIVMTQYRSDVRLFLDGNLQFSSRDEHRYHEPLVHIPMRAVPDARRVLILGGGDGLAARELLKYDRVEHITIVDLDPAMFELARSHPAVTRLNQRSLYSPRVHIRAQDAFVFLEETSETFDVILADLPDPNNTSLARLYSRAFYSRVRNHLAPGGVFVTQATSPYFAMKAFWCIRETVATAAFDNVYPYHVSVPSFGDWGFVMATDRSLHPESLTPQVPTRFLNDNTVPALFAFPDDVQPTERPMPSTLDQPHVLEYYLAGWRYWN